MTPEQIKAIAKKAGCMELPDCGLRCEQLIAFNPAALSEFVQLARESALEEAANIAEAGFKCVKDGYQIADDIRGLKKMSNKQLLQQALDALASYDAEEFEHGAEVMQALRAAIDQLTLSVGDSHFESWYSEYPKSGGSMKPQMRDAYAAGMGDPLVAIAQPESKPVAWFNAKRDMTYLSNHYADDIPLYAAPVDYGHCNTAALRTERDQLKAKNEKLVDASEIALGELDRLIEVLAGRSTIKAANTLRDALKENT